MHTKDVELRKWRSGKKEGPKKKKEGLKKKDFDHFIPFRHAISLFCTGPFSFPFLLILADREKEKNVSIFGKEIFRGKKARILKEVKAESN